MADTTFTITKSQMRVITSINDGLIIGMSSNITELKLEFHSVQKEYDLNRQILLALMHRQLIRWNEKCMCIQLTDFGKRMANLGNKSEWVDKTISSVKAPTIDVIMQIAQSKQKKSDKELVKAAKLAYNLHRKDRVF